MSKYDFIKDKNIVAIHKTLSLDYEEEYNGEKKTIDIRLYPFTVEEKIFIKNSSVETQKLLESKDEKERELGATRAEENLYESVLMVLKKDDKDITLDIVKKMPMHWLNDIVMGALEFEGITKEQIKDVSEKK